MRRAALNGSLREIALARLDRLIAEVKHFPAGQSDLLLEHLQSARIYLLGAMPHEYEFSLLPVDWNDKRCVNQRAPR